MRWMSRHALPMSIVVVAFATIVAVFVFARPDAQAARTEAVVRMADERHVSRADVVRAFAAEHIELVAGPKLGKGRIYTDGHPGDSFTVTIFPTDAVVRFGLTGPKVLVQR